MLPKKETFTKVLHNINAAYILNLTKPPKRTTLSKDTKQMVQYIVHLPLSATKSNKKLRERGEANGRMNKLFSLLLCKMCPINHQRMQITKRDTKDMVETQDNCSSYMRCSPKKAM